MNRQYTKKQIIESIKYWRSQLKQINESEDMIDNNFGIIRSSARDLIYKDSECLGNEVDVEEVYISKYFGSNRLPVEITPEEKTAIQKLQDHNGDGCRVMAYIYRGRVIDDSKWVYASDSIEDEFTYDKYVDPQSDWNERHPDEYDVEFAKEFPTYESWVKYTTANSIKNFKEILKDTHELAYESAAEHVNVDKYGRVYALIAWRA